MRVLGSVEPGKLADLFERSKHWTEAEMLLVQELSENDLPQLIFLLQQMGTDYTIDTDRAQEIWRQMQRYPFYKAYGVWDDDCLVGTFCLLVADNFGHGGSPYAVCDNVVVNASRRRSGIGRLMMNKAMEIARSQGALKLMLSSSFRRTDAHKFYGSLGFREHGLSLLVDLDSYESQPVRQ